MDEDDVVKEPAYVYRDPAQVNYEIDELWTKVDSQNLKIMLGVGLGLTGCALSVLANLALKKLLTNIVQMNSVLTEHHNILAGRLRPGEVDPVPERARPVRPETTIGHGAGIDETRTTPEGAKIATPAVGPETEVSEEVRWQMENDPLHPAHLVKGDGLDEKQIVNEEGKL